MIEDFFFSAFIDLEIALAESGVGGLKIARQAWALAVKLRKLEAIYCTAKTSKTWLTLPPLSPLPPHHSTNTHLIPDFKSQSREVEINRKLMRGWIKQKIYSDL